MGSLQEEVEPIDIYDIVINPEAQRGLFSIAKTNRQFIIDAIDELAFDPRPGNSKLLVNAENLRRLTVGDYRVIYGIEESAQRVTIEMVRERGIVYTLLGALKLAIHGKYSR